MILPQATVFVWIFLQICSGNNERMDDDFKPVMMIANLHYLPGGIVVLEGNVQQPSPFLCMLMFDN